MNAIVKFKDTYTTQELCLKDAYRISKAGEVDEITLLFEGGDIKVNLTSGAISIGPNTLYTDPTPGDRRLILYTQFYARISQSGDKPPVRIFFPVVGFQKTENAKNIKVQVFLDTYAKSAHIFEGDFDYFSGPNGNEKLETYYDLVGEVEQHES